MTILEPLWSSTANHLHLLQTVYPPKIYVRDHSGSYRILVYLYLLKPRNNDTKTRIHYSQGSSPCRQQKEVSSHLVVIGRLFLQQISYHYSITFLISITTGENPFDPGLEF